MRTTGLKAGKAPVLVAGSLLAIGVLQGCAAMNAGGDRLLSRDSEAIQQATVFPMSLDDVRRLVRDGRTPSDVIAELDRTRTVINIRPSEVAALIDSGVPPDVLDWLHQRQLDALGDTWKGQLARQQQDYVKDLQRLRNELELRAFSRYPLGYPYPYFRYGPSWRFGF